MQTNIIKFIFTWVVIVLINTTGYGQDSEECATPNPSYEQIKTLPWFGNNDYLIQTSEKLKRKKASLLKNNEDCEGSSSSTSPLAPHVLNNQQKRICLRGYIIHRVPWTNL